MCFNALTWLLPFLHVAAITPQAYNAYLGESAVSFHCIVTSDNHVFWLVNDSLIEFPNAFGIETTANRTLPEFSLKIPPTVRNNNTRIQCGNGRLQYTPSDTVTFRVQGQLAMLNGSC